MPVTMRSTITFVGQKVGNAFLIVEKQRQ